ncbi:Adenine DNA glycosylase [Candidatus Desulfarcum epimagneticum]|uniref:Adenine DNA glycosylase n=1 Tax=uncultured Desulfobacteraceae bacterium TaxID=218296 RepID=A0A484HGD7_9BACT|nr:Adenine DNA glycosylase [uncultured Desulfobacteraceae bacterium]
MNKKETDEIPSRFPTRALLGWYEANKREMPWRKTRDPYKIWLSEVMLQQTQVKTVIPYYERWVKKFPSIQDLAAASPGEVLKLWEGLGYYNRCHNFHKAARLLVSDFAGRVPDDPDLFIQMPGVGPYILSAVMSIAFGRPLPVVDGNVLRVATRYMEWRDDISKPAAGKKIRRALEGIIPPSNPGDFNQAIMELGALVCVPKNPDCPGCPLKKNCRAKKNGTAASLPFRAKRKKTPLYPVALAVIVKDKKFLIQKRPDSGHLAGMWEFPGGKLEPGESGEEALERECREELGADVKIIQKLKTVKHAYTHFKIELTVFICRPASMDAPPIRSSEGRPVQWIKPEEIVRYPFPAANYKFFKELQAALEKGETVS